MSDFNRIAAEVNKGGIWADENLDQPIDWAGETGSSAAAIDKEVIHTPKTHKAIEAEVLASASVTSDVINIITSRVEQALLRSSGSAEKTIVQMVEAKLFAHSDKIKKWIDGQNTRLAELENQLKDTKSSQIDKLDERIASIELKIDSVIGSITQHGPEEARVLHEAYQIIKDRKSSDDGDRSEPSVYNRMEQRLGSLNEQLRAIEPFADSGIKAKVTEVVNARQVRKKFGRMM
jgi:hypothetical protein